VAKTIKRFRLVEQKENGAMDAGVAGIENLLRPSARPTFGNRLLIGDNEYSLNWATTKLAGKVKCVYIDPPYNTKHNFDHYADSMNSKAWLDFIRLRLVAIKKLLTEDGSVWISIDDNELHYLKVLCDEVLGRENFIINAVWQRTYSLHNGVKFLSPMHEHILVYAKNKKAFKINHPPRSEELNNRFSNPDNDPRGPWALVSLYQPSLAHKRSIAEYTFKNGYVWKPHRPCRYHPDTLKRLDEAGDILFGVDGKAQPRRKCFLSETQAHMVVPSLWLQADVGNTSDAKIEVNAVNKYKPFATPKPERLLHRIIGLATEEGDVVLDAFAGSGTTGAVAHKMGRHWVMMEMGDHAESHIIPRMKRIIAGDDPIGATPVTNWQGGGGFKVFNVEVLPSIKPNKHHKKDDK
jgi:adenine-specific DNA-methyltransferase